MAPAIQKKKDWSAAWRSSMAKLRSSSLQTLSLSSLIRRLDPNRFNGMDRWMVKGVKKRIGSAMSVMLYDMELWQLTACVALGYVLVSLLFTFVLWISLLWNPEGFSGEPPGGMSMFVGIFCMTLSALSQTAVSLTDLMPSSAYTITIVTVAHFAGILMGAVLLGVLINKASIPSARVVFSDVCLLTSRNGEPMLILRIGNTRGNFLLNPEIRVGYLKLEATVEGENIMRMSRIELDEPPAMAPCINIACPIGPDSPLWGKTHADLENEGAAIYVALAATDNQHFQEVYARRFYLVQDMRFNCRFMDIMRTDPSGARLVDFRRFNTVIQNTIMPVSYGLTYDETVIVNGPDVHQPPQRRPSRSSSRASLPSAAAAASSSSSSFDHLKLSQSDRGLAAERAPGARRLWRRPGAAGDDNNSAAGGGGDALGSRGLKVQEREGGGLPDGGAFALSGAASGASSAADSGSPPPMQIKIGSLLPEPDGDMGGITFNKRQVASTGAVSKRMTRLGYFKRVDSEGNSVEEAEHSEHGGASDDDVRFADLEQGETKESALLKRSILNARARVAAAEAARAPPVSDSDTSSSDQGSVDSADLGPELDPVARAREHGKKRDLKIEKNEEGQRVRDHLAPQPETAALMRRVAGQLLDPGAAGTRPRGVLGVGAISTEPCDEADPEEDCGAASDPETSDAPELHMHEGAAAAAPVPRLWGASSADAIPRELRRGAAADAAEPAAAVPLAAGEGTAEAEARPGVPQSISVRAAAGTAVRALAAASAAEEPPSAFSFERAPAGSLDHVLPAATAEPATTAPAGGAAASAAARPAVGPRRAGAAPPAGTKGLPAQWRSGGRGGESVKVSGALRAVLGAKRWRARAIATVPEAAVLEGEANASTLAAVESGGSEGTPSETGTPKPEQKPGAACVRGCPALRATLLGGDTRPMSSALLSASSVFSRTSSEAGDTWGSSKKDL